MFDQNSKAYNTQHNRLRKIQNASTNIKFGIHLSYNSSQFVYTNFQRKKKRDKLRVHTCM